MVNKDLTKLPATYAQASVCCLIPCLVHNLNVFITFTGSAKTKLIPHITQLMDGINAV